MTSAMFRAGVAGGSRIVGREPEYAMLREFLGPGLAAGAFALIGGPGIGKTTLWEAGIGIARECGWRVLCARPSGAEAQMSFAALIDLLDGVETGALAVPAPQLAALEVALLRAQPNGAPPLRHAIALGFLNAVRALGRSERLVVAIDDVQWLDPPSADALAFAVHRLQGGAVVFLLARRPGAPSGLERALEKRGLERLTVGPLSFGATRRFLSERLGLSLSREPLRRIFESTLGNPLFSLEVERALLERGPPEIGGDIPLPRGPRRVPTPSSRRRLLLRPRVWRRAARGARQEAVQLAGHALRLTPPGRVEPDERLVALGEYLASAGEPRRVTELLTRGLASLPAGVARPRVARAGRGRPRAHLAGLPATPRRGIGRVRRRSRGDRLRPREEGLARGRQRGVGNRRGRGQRASGPVGCAGRRPAGRARGAPRPVLGAQHARARDRRPVRALPARVRRRLLRRRLARARRGQAPRLARRGPPRPWDPAASARAGRRARRADLVRAAATSALRARAPRGRA
jgi:AAA ATPase domain